MKITDGAHELTLLCPECEAPVMFPIEIKAELRITGDAGGKLRPLISHKAQDHTCGHETQPSMFQGNGAAPFDTASDPDDDPFDAPERITVVNLPGD